MTVGRKRSTAASTCVGLLVIAAIAGYAASQSLFWVPVTWLSPDGVQLVGKFHNASDPKALTWVLLHGLASTKEEWDAFGRKLANQGAGVFIVDLRGHGESVKTADGKTISYRDWANQAGPWSRMPDDLASAVDILQKKFHVPGVQIAVGGASLGANVAVIYAGTHEHVPALLLLSPGLAYAGLQASKPFAAFAPRPVLMAASPDDQYAFASVQQLARLRRDDSLRLLPGLGAQHGVNMFIDPTFTRDVLDWMKSAGAARR